MIGILIGPDVCNLLGSNSSTLHMLGDIGICFLLFDIGLHLSIREFKRSWRQFLLLGITQCGICTMIFTLVLTYAHIYSFHTALLISLTFSLSSSALVLKLLSDENDAHSPTGKTATHILVFQDLIAILLMVLISGKQNSPVSPLAIITPIGKILLCATAMILFAKIALKPFFAILKSVKSDEVFTATALCIVISASFITEYLHLSLALGAFLGGLALSESSYAYVVRAEVSPFRSLLLGLFFLTLGINFDLEIVTKHFILIMFSLLSFMLLKTAANYLALRLCRIPRENAVLLAPLLAQGSEFGFVLLAVIAKNVTISSDEESFLSAMIGLSLFISPFLTSIGCVLSRSACNVRKEESHAQDSEKEVIILGIDTYGRTLASLLEQEGIPYRAHDFDFERLSYAQSRGFNAYFSDIHRPRTLGRVSLGKALAIVTFLEEHTVLEALVHGVKQINPSLPLLSATEDISKMEQFISLGIKDTFKKQESSLLSLYQELLNQLGYLDAEIKIKIERAREMIDNNTLFPRTVVSNLETTISQAA